jgi:hypothetical protein
MRDPKFRAGPPDWQRSITPGEKLGARYERTVTRIRIGERLGRPAEAAAARELLATTSSGAACEPA